MRILNVIVFLLTHYIIGIIIILWAIILSLNFIRLKSNANTKISLKHLLPGIT